MKYKDYRYNHNLLWRVPFTSVYNMPVIEPADIDIEELRQTECIGFDRAVQYGCKGKGVHFYLDDFKFERIWNNISRYVDLLSESAYMLTPDFSMFTDWPFPVQIFNNYRGKYVGRYMQDCGINVIPTVCWSDGLSYDYAFDGLPTGGIVSISSVGAKRHEELFSQGYNAMIEALKPKAVLVYRDSYDIPKVGNEEIIEITCFSKRERERIENGR